MNKKIIPFFKKSFYFFLGFFILIFVLDQLIKLSVKQINVGEFGILNKINDGEINADILISGSSRALKAINPEIISKETKLSCYNIASDGSDLGIQLPKFKWYLNNNKNPQILIQDISQFGGSISSTIYEPFKYLSYLSDDSLYDGLKRINTDLWLHKYFAPANLIYYNFDFYSKIGLDILQTIKGNDKYLNGFLPDKSKWKSDFDLYKNNNSDGIKCSVSDKFFKYLKKLKEFCKEEEIKLILVVLPNYYRLKEISINLSDVTKIYTSLSEEPEVYLFDFSDNEISRNENYLYNFTHLNITGANLLSEKLALNILNKMD